MSYLSIVPEKLAKFFRGILFGAPDRLLTPMPHRHGCPLLWVENRFFGRNSPKRRPIWMKSGRYLFLHGIHYICRFSLTPSLQGRPNCAVFGAARHPQLCEGAWLGRGREQVGKCWIYFEEKNPTVITALQYRNGPQVQSCGMDAKSLNTVRRPNENDFVVYVISTNLLYTTDFNDLGDKPINVRRGLCRRKKTSGCF